MYYYYSRFFYPLVTVLHFRVSCNLRRHGVFKYSSRLIPNRRVIQYFSRHERLNIFCEELILKHRIRDDLRILRGSYELFPRINCFERSKSNPGILETFLFCSHFFFRATDRDQLCSRICITYFIYPFHFQKHPPR